MIIRSRPKYIERESLFPKSKNVDNELQDEYYFNYGRSALKFFLKQYIDYYKVKPNVMLQSFNCSVVSEAVLQSGANLYISDVKLTDFSISFEDVKKNSSEIDILLLTHYQGIPNSEYITICNYCLEKNILLIDDVSQTENSYIDNVLVGSLSDLSLHSFSFDKPFTSLYGGSFKINKLKDRNFIDHLRNAYNELSYESNVLSDRHLRLLAFKYKYSTKDNYCLGLNYDAVILFLDTIKCNERMKYFIIKSLFIVKVINKLLPKRNNEITLVRLNERKINSILIQRKKYNQQKSNVELLERYLVSCGATLIKRNNCEIAWNRYSLIDKNHKIKVLLDKKNMEVGNYNWPVPLHQLYHNRKNVRIVSNCSNSSYLAENILNIPVWFPLEDRINYIDNN